MLHSQLSVLLSQDPLDDNRQAGDGLQPVHVLPADGGVQGVGRDPVLLWHSCLLRNVHLHNHCEHQLITNVLWFGVASAITDNYKTIAVRQV